MSYNPYYETSKKLYQTNGVAKNQDNTKIMLINMSESAKNKCGKQIG